MPAFRDGRLGFTGIVEVIADVVHSHDVPSEQALTVDDVLAADAWARATAADLIQTRGDR